MSSKRRLGFVFGLLTFLGICAAALFSPLGPGTIFAGAAGIEDDVTESAAAAVSGIDGAQVEVDGRDVTVILPRVLPHGVDRDAIERQLLDDDAIATLSISGGHEVAVPDPGTPLVSSRQTDSSELARVESSRSWRSAMY